ncbi:MAG: carboxypeptidase regulatory-like domain-containing protein [Gemmatimonadaceae bacterium]
MRQLCGTLALALNAAVAGAQVVTGFVREDSTRRPIVDAEVSVAGSSRSTRTNVSGAFRLDDVPTGSQTLRVRRVGYEPVDTAVIVATGTQEVEVHLRRGAQRLDTIAVPARRARGIGRDGFAERRAMGFGKFLDSTTLRRNEHRRLSDLLPDQGVRIIIPPQCSAQSLRRRGPNAQPPIAPPFCDVNPNKRVAISASSRDACPLQVIIDGSTMYRDRRTSGQPVQWENTFDLNGLSVSGVDLVEVYRRSSEMPQQFTTDLGGCGALVIWTRRAR